MQHVAIFWADGLVTILRGRYAEDTALKWLHIMDNCRMIHCYHNHKVYFSEHTARVN